MNMFNCNILTEVINSMFMYLNNGFSSFFNHHYYSTICLFFLCSVNFFAGGAIANSIFPKIHPVMAKDFITIDKVDFPIYTIPYFPV